MNSYFLCSRSIYGSDHSKLKLLDPNSLGQVQQVGAGALLEYRDSLEGATTDLLSSYPTALGGSVDGAPLAAVGVGLGLGVYPTTVGHEHDTAVYMMEMQGMPGALSHSHVNSQITNDPEQENNNKSVKKGECYERDSLSGIGLMK